jgi:hypothetical protein
MPIHPRIQSAGATFGASIIILYLYSTPREAKISRIRQIPV